MPRRKESNVICLVEQDQKPHRQSTATEETQQMPPRITLEMIEEIEAPSSRSKPGAQTKHMANVPIASMQVQQSMTRRKPTRSQKNSTFNPSEIGYQEATEPIAS